MIHIAICDDDSSIAQQIHQYLKAKDASLPEVTLDISIYPSGEAFLAAMEQGLMFHIVFMDIQMQNISGVEAGQILRKQPGGDDVIMIYVSYHDSFFEDLIQIGSFRFIRKPLEEAQLDHVFTRALNLAVKYKNSLEIPNLFSFKIGTETHVVRSDNIVYMRNFRRIIEIHVWDSAAKAIGIMSKFYSRMDDVLKKLPEGAFVRCEHSHIVNLRYVQQMAKDSFILTDQKGTCIPIGRAYKAETKQAYFKYMEGLA